MISFAACQDLTIVPESVQSDDLYFVIYEQQHRSLFAKLSWTVCNSSYFDSMYIYSLSMEMGNIRELYFRHSLFHQRNINVMKGHYAIDTKRRLNILKPRRHVGLDFVDENIWISIKISLKVVHWGPMNNIPLVQIMTWRRPRDKPLSEPMMVSLLTHICVTWPQWINR